MSLTPGRARQTAGLIAALGALVAVPAAEAGGVRVSDDTLITAPTTAPRATSCA